MLAILTLLSLSADPAGYGDVTGRFVLKGAVPVLPPLVAKGDMTAKDPHVAAVEGVPDESLVVAPKSKGIANVVLWVIDFDAQPHPRFEKEKADPNRERPTLIEKNCRFVPHIAVVTVPDVLVVRTDDACAHNPRSQFVRNNTFSLTPRPQGSGIEVPLDSPEPLPMPFKCDIHPYESAYLLVLDHPYSAVTDSEGRFTIADLPAGQHTLRVWHERVGYLDRELVVTVEAGETLDLGDKGIEVARFFKDG